jgi:hypothetical protein
MAIPSLLMDLDFRSQATLTEYKLNCSKTKWHKKIIMHNRCYGKNNRLPNKMVGTNRQESNRNISKFKLNIKMLLYLEPKQAVKWQSVRMRFADDNDDSYFNMNYLPGGKQ